MEDKEMEILELLSRDNVFEFLIKFKEIEEKYRAMKKVYDKNINNKIKEIADNTKIAVENDVFRVTVSEPSETEKVISIREARKLPEEIKEMVIKKGMTSPRLRITLIEDETEDFD